MNSTLEPFQYLKRLFSPDFIASLSEENFLHRLLVEQRPEADIWRQHINDCLELAYRYNLVDADLDARLKKGDWESWQAAINELKAAKYMEGIFRIGCLNWHPKGRERKVGEFEIILSGLDVPIFVEVKTILPRDLENLEQRVFEKLRRSIRTIQLPFGISIRLESAGQTENFSQNFLKEFLIRELNKLNTKDASKLYKLPKYQDKKTGLHLDIQAFPSSKYTNCYLGVCSFNARFMNNSEYVKFSLSKALEKLDKGDIRPLLVILCPSPNHLIDEHDVLNACLGTETFVVTMGSDGSVVDTKTTRKPDGLFQYKPKLSLIGIYKDQSNEKTIKGDLELYHNPSATHPIGKSVFKGRGVRQLVKKNDLEMEWIN